MNLPDGLIDRYWTVLAWCWFAIAASPGGEACPVARVD
jgi:hypothetical protein